MMRALELLLAICLAVAAEAKCGYESCNRVKPGFINLHLVPHTHDDVGWLKTVDQYFYGNRNDITDAGVQYILDSVVQALKENPNRRFIYVETAFFWKWWQQQSSQVQSDVKALVNNGQLEIIGGSWSMPDEATTHYQSLVDDWTYGFRKLTDALGVCARPKVGWQIDPFGHSKGSAAIMAKLGFDGLFLGRIDYQDRNVRMRNKTAEMIWLTSSNDQSTSSQLFTGVNYNTYQHPAKFCFDINCHDEPIVDDPSSPEFNAPSRATEFIGRVREWAEAYRTKNVLVTMGDDFMYQNAKMNFKNMDKLIEWVNKKQKEGSLVNALYSTPSCYLKAVHDSQVSFPVKSDDFLPYSSDPYAFWSGYFTSRPTLKYFERMGNNYMQISKQLSMLAGTGSQGINLMESLKDALAIVQHHDAITGTEQQHVTDDYARRLNVGLKDSEKANTIALKKIMSKRHVEFSLDSCFLRNISQCAISENNDGFVVTIYNPLSREVNHTVRIPITDDKFQYTVLCPMGKSQETQIVQIPETVLNIPGRESQATAELIFTARNLPPLGFRSYHISKNTQKYVHHEVKMDKGRITLGYPDLVSVTLNEQGELESVNISGKSIPVKQELLQYVSAVGNNEVFQNRSSGAYIFRANGSAIALGAPKKIQAVKGPLVTEIRQVYTDWATQIIRLYADTDYVEFLWIAGPIEMDYAGREVISRFTTQIKNGGVFYTDTNGREVLKRQLNHRDTWKVKLAEPVPGNYYPIVTQVSIEDGSNRMTVITDRAQGGSSLDEGQVELMVHRRLTHDDAFGVGEALNETAFGKGLVALGSHFVTFESPAKARLLVQQRVLNSWVFFSPTNGLSFQEWSSAFHMEYSGLRSPLPDNVQILTLEPWVPGRSYLLRLEHIMESTDDPVLSLPVTVDLRKIFGGLRVTSVTETMLGANERVSESNRLIWTTDSSGVSSKPHKNKDLPQITLNPMEIRTFIITH